MSTQYQLLKQRRFGPYFLTQLFGPLNVNAFKTAFITFLTFNSGQMTDLNPSLLITILPAVFILPYFFFSATSGQMADRFDRAQLIRISKQFELVISLMASIGFLFSYFWLLVIALFLSGAQTTQFAPLKYAYLPQHLNEHELTGGNGLVEASTFVSILIGQVIGAWLVSAGNLWSIPLALMILSIAGWLSSLGIPSSPPPAPNTPIDWNPITATRSVISVAREDKILWRLLLAISWFWLYGATMLAQFPMYTKLVLGGTESIYIVLLCMFSLGVGLGSLICEKLSRGHIHTGLITLGALIMALPGIDLYFATMNLTSIYDGSIFGFLSLIPHWRILLDITLIGAGGGLYIVPLYALMQSRCEPKYMAQVIATSSILNAGFMFSSSLLSLFLLKIGFNIPQLFLLLAIGTIIIATLLLLKMQGFATSFLILIRGR